MLAETAAVLFMTPPTFAFERVFTGTGTSCPEAMIAFLLLLVKTVGRAITLNRFVDSSRYKIDAKALPAGTYILVCIKLYHFLYKCVAGCHVNISSLAYVLDDLAEVDQIGRIENIGDYRC